MYMQDPNALIMQPPYPAAFNPNVMPYPNAMYPPMMQAQPMMQQPMMLGQPMMQQPMMQQPMMQQPMMQQPMMQQPMPVDDDTPVPQKKAAAAQKKAAKRGPPTLAEVNYHERRAHGMPPPIPCYGPGQLGTAGFQHCQVCGRTDLKLLTRPDTGKKKCLNCVGISSPPTFSFEQEIYGQYEGYDQRAFDMSRVLAQCPQPVDIPFPSLLPVGQYPAIMTPPAMQYITAPPAFAEAPLQIQYTQPAPVFTQPIYSAAPQYDFGAPIQYIQ
jgi:hypothetical protein